MEIRGRKVLLLGGSGLVGMAVAREMLCYQPALIVITALTRAEAENAVAELKQDKLYDSATRVAAEWGDMFLPQVLKDIPRRELLDNSAYRNQVIDELYRE